MKAHFDLVRVDNANVKKSALESLVDISKINYKHMGYYLEHLFVLLDDTLRA